MTPGATRGVLCSVDPATSEIKWDPFSNDTVSPEQKKQVELDFKAKLPPSA